FEPDGRVNDKVGLYVGMDRFDLRKQIVKDLKAVDLLEKEEDYTNKVGHSERTDAVIEPKLSAQWFLKMPSLAGPALEVVMDDTVCFHPAKFKNTYRHWMETIKDWCISRQLWWGQRIPAYYLPNKEVVVARTAEDALALAKSRYPEAAGYTLADLRQDEDVLDTWFSSWLWPMSVFDGVTKPDNPEINYYYPVCDLVTAPDIMFFWVARMIMAGLHFRKQVPFSHVYYTGTVRDKLGRKMSKSLGNSPDPIGLIEKYGADGVRVGMLLTSPAGNDLPFDEAMCEQGRNFCNKIWNALRLIKGWTVSDDAPDPIRRTAMDWFSASLRQTAAFMEDCYTKYRLSDALMAGYKLVWDEFCAWYLEIIKPAYGQPIDRETYEKTLDFFDGLMALMHPFMPFLTEEIW
ncbi:MAG: class I tRNA ligase family protein, partial [Bacteroidales bacterium]|nr:class I tRNA ligase family protein [Bacteroidales bacterium]